MNRYWDIDRPGIDNVAPEDRTYIECPHCRKMFELEANGKGRPDIYDAFADYDDPDEGYVLESWICICPHCRKRSEVQKYFDITGYRTEQLKEPPKNSDLSGILGGKETKSSLKDILSRNRRRRR